MSDDQKFSRNQSKNRSLTDPCTALSTSTTLLDNALANLPTDKRNDLLHKAAEERLNLEVKAGHMNIDYAAAKRDIDTHVERDVQL